MSTKRAPEGLSIRPFDGSDADYEASVAIWNAIWPDEPSSVEGSKYRDSILDEKFLFERLMVELDGGIVATAIYREPFCSYAPGKYDIQIRVLPEHHRRGVGSATYDHIMDRLNEQIAAEEDMKETAKSPSGKLRGAFKKLGFTSKS